MKINYFNRFQWQSCTALHASMRIKICCNCVFDSQSVSQILYYLRHNILSNDSYSASLKMEETLKE